MIIEEVIPGTIADQLGVEPGDRLKLINNESVRDILDYRFLTCAEIISVLLKKKSGEEWLLDIEKDYEEDLGICFKQEGLGRIKRCRNNCIFCFLAQMPRGMRKTLYFNDDDYRLSFLHGNFITLTNLNKRDLERIVKLRLSPLYISVHTTNAGLRNKMLNNRRSEKIMDQLAFLAQGGIRMQTQAVVCPEINDGQELQKTIEDLYSLWPAVNSLAVVPVGLTRYRDGLFPLQGFTREKARDVLALVEKSQKRCLKQGGYPFVFAGDEFYLAAGLEFPGALKYGGFPQAENGVGLARLFIDEWAKTSKKLPEELSVPEKATIVTGGAGRKLLIPVIEKLNRVKNLKVSLSVIENSFFGEKVTAAGLLTPADVYSTLTGAELGDMVVIPSIMLKKDEPVFLDGSRVNDLAGKLKAKVVVADGPRGIVEAIFSNQKNVITKRGYHA
jgi:putative radical SAM enzyme (TIGR03279 family)